MAQAVYPNGPLVLGQGQCARLLFFQVSIRPGAPLVPPRPDPSTPAFLYVAVICIDKNRCFKKTDPRSCISSITN